MSTKVIPVSLEMASRAHQFSWEIVKEYKSAREKFGPFDNGHEGLAVIWEEFEELKKFVFGKDHTLEEIENAIKECEQLAAMVMAFRLELLP